MRFLTILSLLGLCGCSWLPAKIKSGATTVTAVKDAGKPATLETGDKGESLPIPAGSSLTVTKVEAMPAAPNVPAQPAREVTEVHLTEPTVWTRTEKTVKADTGTVDTSVALKKVETAESRVLLYAALAAMLGAGVFVYLHYPTPAMMCAGAAVVLFIAWKVAGMPDWLWGVGAAALGGAVFLYIGHERGLNTPKTP